MEEETGVVDLALYSYIEMDEELRAYSWIRVPRRAIDRSLYFAHGEIAVVL